MVGTNPQRNGRIQACSDHAIAEAAALLQAGEIVAVPTETVYGLAADAANANAVAAIYRAKGRPDFNPLIVHVADVASARQLAVFDARAVNLARQFWPGPLTMVLPVLPGAPIAAAVTAGLATVALRCPAHRVMQSLLTQSGLCLAAPSANRSGHISPTCAAHVLASLGKDAPLILDGGQCAAGLESTIVALRAAEWQILRHGVVTADNLMAVLRSAPTAVTHAKIEAPGQMAAHYAPVKPLRLNALAGDEDEYMIGFGSVAGDINLSVSGNLAEAAAGLFAALHTADASTRCAIAVAPIPGGGIGLAINDRLSRAAAR